MFGCKLRYEVGDKVVIKSNLEDKYDGILVIGAIRKRVGEAVTIKEVRGGEGLPHYYIEEYPGNPWLSDGMIDHEATANLKEGEFGTLRYEVGDKVLIREGLIHGAHYWGVPYNSKMEFMTSEAVEIIRIDLGPEYIVRSRMDEWYLTNEMIDHEATAKLKEEKELTEKNKAPRYKEGDKVVLRSDLTGGRDYDNLYCNKSMEEMAGDEVIITGATVVRIMGYDGDRYKVSGTRYIFSNAMIDHVRTAVLNDLNEEDTIPVPVIPSFVAKDIEKLRRLELDSPTSALVTVDEDDEYFETWLWKLGERTKEEDFGLAYISGKWKVEGEEDEEEKEDTLYYIPIIPGDRDGFLNKVNQGKYGIKWEINSNAELLDRYQTRFTVDEIDEIDPKLMDIAKPVSESDMEEV